MASSSDIVLPTTNSLQSHIENNLPFYRFHRLSEYAELEHAIFTRHGGVSSPPFESLNLSYDTGDEPSKVKENLHRVRAVNGGSQLIYSRQTHSSNIRVLGQMVDFDPALPYPFNGMDGFATQLPGLLMMIKVADCQAILLYDPHKRVAAIIHAGWRGSVQNIPGRAIHLMKGRFNCQPQEIIASIGPSLGPCCAEYDNWRQDFPPGFSAFQSKGNHFDFWAISRDQLRKSGLRPENIETAGLCTKCNPETFYSYRGERQTGRFAATIAIKDTRH
jgi:YfiH family protein